MSSLRTIRVYKKLDGWVALWDGTEFWFDEWTDALTWAVRMVGSQPHRTYFVTLPTAPVQQELCMDPQCNGCDRSRGWSRWDTNE